MKTAMQELIEWLETRDMRNYQNKYAFRQGVLAKINQALEKEKEQIKILTDALERIKDWDDEMHSEWDDQGEFASFTLKTYNQNK